MALAASPSLILAVSHSPTSGPNQGERGGCMPISTRSGSVAPPTAELHLVSAGGFSSRWAQATPPSPPSFGRAVKQAAESFSFFLRRRWRSEAPPPRAEVYGDSAVIKGWCVRAVPMAHVHAPSRFASKQPDSFWRPALSPLRPTLPVLHQSL